MSDFGTRLERELMAAAEREQRRPRMLPRRPRPRRWSVALAIATAVAALALAVGPVLRSPHDSNLPSNGQPLRPLSPALLGDYSRGATSLVLDRTRYTLVLPAGEDTGDVSAAGSLLVLSSDGNGVCRYQDGRGQYRFELRRHTLRLHRLVDRCHARGQALDGGTFRFRG